MPRLRKLVILLLLTFLEGWRFPLVASSDQPREPDYSLLKVILHGKPFDLHLARPRSVAHPEVLVLYASGDGGWFGAGLDMFKDLARMGYPTAGFSSRSYVKLLGYGENPVTVEELTSDYMVFIRQAKTTLALPSATRTILTGWSRGAAFAVLVGSEKEIQSQLAGVIAIGLPDKEELKFRFHGKKIYVNEYRQSKQHLLFDTYQRVPQLMPLRCALIQSTRDDYLRADQARALFGSDSKLKKFCPVQARNHRFSGGWRFFLTSLEDCLNWVSEPVGNSNRVPLTSGN